MSAMEPAGQCSYVGCDKPWTIGRTFYNIPVKNAGLCVKWLINSGRENLLTYESTILESMNLAICSDHFQSQNFNEFGNLKDDAVPLQYWDLGYSRELGEIEKTDIADQCQNDGNDSATTSESEWSDNDSEVGTDDEFRTQLGNEIEALLNAVQTSRGQTPKQNKRKQGFDQSLQGFYKKLNLKGDKNVNKNRDLMSANNLIEFRKATKDMCRTCAKKKIRLVDITDKTIHSEIDIITKLKLLIEIKDHDVLPAKICQECLVKLEQSYTFFQQIYKADNILHDMLFEYKRPSKRISNTNKYNSHNNIQAKHKSGATEAKKFCLEVNDLPFKNNGESTWVVDDGIDNKMIDVQNSNGFDGDIHESHNIEDKSSVNSEVYSSRNTENTVSYLLSDFCNDNAELNWLDVVGIMEKKGKKPDANEKAVNSREKVPTGGLRISCRYCDSSFRLRRQLKTHITVNHLQPTNYICEYCNICCKSGEDLSEHHAQSHFRRKYKCNDCEEIFSKKLELKLHIERIHSKNENNITMIEEACYTCGEKVLASEMSIHAASHPEQTFTCDECEKTFTSKKTLCNHIHRLHPPFAYTCTICDKVMHSGADTYKHMTTHDKSPLFPCLECGRMFYNTERLEKHKNTHGKNSLKKRKRVWFHCQLCDASYRVAEELIKHIETHSSEDWESYRNKILYCGECNARLIGNEKFRVHKMRYHLAKRGDFICLLCDKVSVQNFQSLKEYEKHINLHSNELKRAAPRRYKCEHCDKAFKSNSHRINHIDSFHSDVMHSCPICNLKVKRKGNLKDHIERVHSAKKEHGTIEVYLGEKRFPWNIYGKELSTAKQKDEHEDAHPDPCQDLEKLFPWAQRYSCDHCHKNFYYIHELRQHLLEKHNDKDKAAIIEVLEEDQQFKCAECEAAFEHKSSLATHMKGVHSGIEHACKICGLKCELASGLKKHLLTHDRDRALYKCQYCDKEFTHEESMKNHELNHHVNDGKRIERDSPNGDDDTINSEPSQLELSPNYQ